MRLLRTAEVKFVGSTVAVAGSRLAEISVVQLFLSVFMSLNLFLN